MDEFKKGYLYARAMHTSTFTSEFFCVLQRRGVFYMARFLHHDFSCTRCKQSMLLLSSLWIMGLLSGIWVFAASDPSVISLMRSAVYSPVSIVGLTLTFLLPFLFSAFAVFNHTPIWIFPISAYKAFSFSIVSIGLVDSMGSAGWLYWILLLTGDILSMPVLYLYWLRSLLNVHGMYAKTMTFLPIVVFLLGGVNNCFLLHVLAEIGNR